jgi:hypothetical protein
MIENQIKCVFSLHNDQVAIMKSLKIPKGYSEADNRRTDNAIDKHSK